jgi:hypothetical protein
MSKHPSTTEFSRPQRERSVHPEAAAPGVAEPGAAHAPDELSASDRELLSAARRELQRDPVPGAVRQRLFERTLDEARRVEPGLAQPLSPLVPVAARGVWLVLGSAAAMAAGLMLVASARPLFRGAAGDDPIADGERPRPEQRLGDRIFQSALFRAAAPEWSGALPSAGASLFGERPFSPQSHAWQVRRWDNLGADPGEAAKYDFDGGALCVTLSAGERVIGGWPWLPSAADAPAARPAALVPVAPVALSAGKAYQLVFKAWAAKPLPSQVLIAVGHAQLPFSAAGAARVEVSTTPEPFVVSFVAKHADPSVGVAFLASASEGAEPTRVCLSDVTLTERPR